MNWHLHRGHIIIPKTTNEERLTENLSVYDFNLTQEEYEQITQLDEGVRFYNPERYSSWNNLPYF